MTSKAPRLGQGGAGSSRSCQGWFDRCLPTPPLNPPVNHPRNSPAAVASPPHPRRGVAPPALPELSDHPKRHHTNAPLVKGAGGYATTVEEPPGGCLTNSGKLDLSALDLRRVQASSLGLPASRDNPRAYATAVASALPPLLRGNSRHLRRLLQQVTHNGRTGDADLRWRFLAASVRICEL
jgi:hypothetical protein